MVQRHRHPLGPHTCPATQCRPCNEEGQAPLTHEIPRDKNQRKAYRDSATPIKTARQYSAGLTV